MRCPFRNRNYDRILFCFSFMFFFLFEIIYNILFLFDSNDAMTHLWCDVQLMTHTNYLLHCSSYCDDWYDDSFMLRYSNDDSFSPSKIILPHRKIFNGVKWFTPTPKILPHRKIINGVKWFTPSKSKSWGKSPKNHQNFYPRAMG